MPDFGWLTKLPKFNVLPVTVATALVYAAVFTAVSVTDQTPSVPEDLSGLNLDQAYLDLHKVSIDVVCTLARTWQHRGPADAPHVRDASVLCFIADATFRVVATYRASDGPAEWTVFIEHDPRS